MQRTAVDGISQMSRATQGVIVQRLREGDRISAVAMVDASVELGGLEGEELPLDSTDGAAPALPASELDGVPDAGDDDEPA